MSTVSANRVSMMIENDQTGEEMNIGINQFGTDIAPLLKFIIK